VIDPDEIRTFDRVFALLFDPTGSHPAGYDAELATFAGAAQR
jgi:hypothetical protein